MKPTPITDLARCVEQKRAKLDSLRREHFATREAYQSTVARRRAEVEKWERRLLAAVAASTLRGEKSGG